LRARVRGQPRAEPPSMAQNAKTNGKVEPRISNFQLPFLSTSVCAAIRTMQPKTQLMNK